MQKKIKPDEFLNCKRQFWNDRSKRSEHGHGRNESWRGRQRRDLDFHQVSSVLLKSCQPSRMLPLSSGNKRHWLPEFASLLPIISQLYKFNVTALLAALMTPQSYFFFFFLAPMVESWEELQMCFPYFMKDQEGKWQDMAVGLKRCSVLDIRWLWPLAS